MKIYYIDTDERPRFFLLLKDHIFISCSEITLRKHFFSANGREGHVTWHLRRLSFTLQATVSPQEDIIPVLRERKKVSISAFWLLAFIAMLRLSSYFYKNCLEKLKEFKFKRKVQNFSVSESGIRKWNQESRNGIWNSEPKLEPDKEMNDSSWEIWLISILLLPSLHSSQDGGWYTKETSNY